MAPPRTAKPKVTTRLDFTMSDETAARLAKLQDSIRRSAGHGRPTPKTLVSALIMAEERRGKALEDDLLVPFRLSQPYAD